MMQHTPESNSNFKSYTNSNLNHLENEINFRNGLRNNLITENQSKLTFSRKHLFSSSKHIQIDNQANEIIDSNNFLFQNQDKHKNLEEYLSLNFKQFKIKVSKYVSKNESILKEKSLKLRIIIGYKKGNNIKIQGSYLFSNYLTFSEVTSYLNEEIVYSIKKLCNMPGYLQNIYIGFDLMKIENINDSVLIATEIVPIKNFKICCKSSVRLTLQNSTQFSPTHELYAGELFFFILPCFDESFYNQINNIKEDDFSKLFLEISLKNLQLDNQNYFQIRDLVIVFNLFPSGERVVVKPKGKKFHYQKRWPILIEHLCISKNFVMNFELISYTSFHKKIGEVKIYCIPLLQILDNYIEYKNFNNINFPFVLVNKQFKIKSNELSNSYLDINISINQCQTNNKIIENKCSKTKIICNEEEEKEEIDSNSPNILVVSHRKNESLNCDPAKNLVTQFNENKTILPICSQSSKILSDNIDNNEERNNCIASEIILNNDFDHFENKEKNICQDNDINMDQEKYDYEYPIDINSSNSHTFILTFKKIENAQNLNNILMENNNNCKDLFLSYSFFGLNESNVNIPQLIQLNHCSFQINQANKHCIPSDIFSKICSSNDKLSINLILRSNKMVIGDSYLESKIFKHLACNEIVDAVSMESVVKSLIFGHQDQTGEKILLGELSVKIEYLPNHQIHSSRQEKSNFNYQFEEKGISNLYTELNIDDIEFSYSKIDLSDIFIDMQIYPRNSKQAKKYKKQKIRYDANERRFKFNIAFPRNNFDTFDNQDDVIILFKFYRNKENYKEKSKKILGNSRVFQKDIIRQIENLFFEVPIYSNSNSEKIIGYFILKNKHTNKDTSIKYNNPKDNSYSMILGNSQMEPQANFYSKMKKIDLIASNSKYFYIKILVNYEEVSSFFNKFITCKIRDMELVGQSIIEDINNFENPFQEYIVIRIKNNSKNLDLMRNREAIIDFYKTNQHSRIKPDHYCGSIFIPLHQIATNNKIYIFDSIFQLKNQKKKLFDKNLLCRVEIKIDFIQFDNLNFTKPVSPFQIPHINSSNHNHKRISPYSHRYPKSVKKGKGNIQNLNENHYRKDERNIRRSSFIKTNNSFSNSKSFSSDSNSELSMKEQQCSENHPYNLVSNFKDDYDFLRKPQKQNKGFHVESNSTKKEN